MAAIHKSITRGYNGRTITIFTDSQAALKALESVTVKSKLVLECLGCISELATHNPLQLEWVLRHEGILGNKRTNELAKKGKDTPFTGPEPILGLPYSVVKQEVERKHIECWTSGKDSKHSKALMEGPQEGRRTKLLNVSSQHLFVVIGLLTGHLGLNGHLYKIGKDIDPLCRRLNTCYMNANP